MLGEFLFFAKKRKESVFNIKIIPKIVFTNKNNRYFGRNKKIEKVNKFVLTN